MDQTVSLRSSIVFHRRVLHALLLREVITRFGRHNLGALWLVCEPMLYTTGVAVLWSFAGLDGTTSIPIVAFAVTGYSTVLMWRNAASRCTAAVEANKQLLFHRNVRVMDVFLTRIILELAGATASFIILSLFFIFIVWLPPPADHGKVVFGWLMMAWLAAGIALTIGAGTAFSEVVDRLWHPCAYLLFPLSGAAFMVAWIPPGLRKYVLIVPMVHGTEMIRQGWFGNFVKTYYSTPYMAVWSLLLTFVGLYLSWEAGRRVEI
jgi:capsular polysaccharide transport system permease protein